MMRKIAAACVVLGATLAPIAAYAVDGDMDRDHPATFAKDSVVTARIKAKLAAEHVDTLKHISVDTDANGKVWLHGVVDSRNEARKVITIARNTEGVTSVVSKLEVRPEH